MSDYYPPTSGSTTGNPLTEARLFAIQAMYQCLLLNRSLAEVLEEFTLHRLQGAQVETKLFSQILRGVSEERDRYQTLISAQLRDGWTFDRLGLVERSLLFCAAYELDARVDTPFKVIISEYVGLARHFFDDPQVKFTNGVLQTIADKTRPDEVAKAKTSA